jgi:hypothetical protein
MRTYTLGHGAQKSSYANTANGTTAARDRKLDYQCT